MAWTEEDRHAGTQIQPYSAFRQQRPLRGPVPDEVSHVQPATPTSESEALQAPPGDFRDDAHDDQSVTSATRIGSNNRASQGIWSRC